VTNILTSVAFMLMQVGLNPAAGGMPGIPDELRDRPPRETADTGREASTLAKCLQQTSGNPQTALNTAQRWRETADSDLGLAQSAHCLGLAMVKLGRMNEARQAFELASAEAPKDNLGYAARLSAMAGNAAVAEGDIEAALPLLDRAGGMALAAEDGPLAAGLRVDLARILVRADREEDAAAALAEAREADETNAEAWLLSATLSRRLERLGEAQSQIERAALLAPRNPQVGLEAGVIAAMSGREADAISSFSSVLEMAPDSVEAQRAQGYLDQLRKPSPE